MRLRTACILTATLIAATPVAAMRLRFDVRYAGAKIDGAEVCIHPSPGLGGDDPLPKYFASNDVRCLPADKILAFPAGKWSYVTRVGERYVSYGASMDIVRGEAEAGYKEIVVEVNDAVSIDFAAMLPSLAPGEFVVVYFPSTRARLATAAPLPRGASSMQIPVGVPWIPIVTDGKTLLRAGALHASTLKPESVAAAELTADPRSVSVVAWLRWAAGDRDYVINNAPPEVVLVDGTAERRPEADAGRVFSDGLVIFRNVPRTACELRVRGELWEARSVPVAAPPPGRAVTLVPALPAIPAGAVEAMLSIDPALLHARAKPRTCEPAVAASAEPAALTIELARCAQLLPDMAAGELQQLGGCEAVAHREVAAEELAAPVRFGGLATGMYRLAARHAVLPPKFVSVSVVAGRRIEVPFDLRYANVYGHVTRGGKPVAAKVAFSGGEAASAAETGEYAAVLRDNPERRLVTVTGCNAAWRYTFVPETPVVAGAVFDIDIPANRLDVTAVDAATQKPVAGARVSATANAGEDDAPPRIVRASGTATTAEGTTALEPLLPKRKLELCARHDDYEQRCESVAALDADETRAVTLHLTRIAKQDGRVVSPFSTKQLLLMWVDAAGAVTGTDLVHDDGSFRYDPRHGGERVVLVSASHPLALLRPVPATAEEPLTITVPNGPLRTLQVRLAPEAAAPNAVIALRFGTLTMPFGAFSRHQLMRGLDQEVRNRGPLVIPDLLATEPLFVMRGPDPEQLPRDVKDIEAACARAEFRALCTVVPAGTGGLITFR